VGSAFIYIYFFLYRAEEFVALIYEECFIVVADIAT